MKIPDTIEKIEKSEQPEIQEAPSSKTALETAKKARKKLVNKASNLSKRNKVLLGCLAIGAMGLMITNPRKEAYLEYVSTQLPERVAGKCENISDKLEITPFFFRVPAKDACKGGILGTSTLFRPVIRAVASVATKDRTNLLLCSIHTTKVPGIGTFRTLGIGGQFITILGE